MNLGNRRLERQGKAEPERGRIGFSSARAAYSSKKRVRDCGRVSRKRDVKKEEELRRGVEKSMGEGRIQQLSLSLPVSSEPLNQACRYPLEYPRRLC